MSLPSSMADFVPRDGLLQKAYYVRRAYYMRRKVSGAFEKRALARLYLIAEFIFVAFNKRAEIPANWHQPGSCNQALKLQT